MTLQISRRGLIGGLAAFIAAPAIVRASSIMPVKAWNDLAEFERAAAAAFQDFKEALHTGDFLAARDDGRVFRAAYGDKIIGVCLGVAKNGESAIVELTGPHHALDRLHMGTA